jgi:hypothetical protein
MRQDFLRECMAPYGNVQLDAFNREFCLVCANRECARSSANNSAFDTRVLAWKDRLFEKVPRANDLDSSFDHIRAKRFLPVQAETLEVRSVETAAPSPRFDPPPRPPPRIEEAVQPPNTPFLQGQMIGGGGETFLQPGGSFTFGGGDDEPVKE